MLSVAQLVTFLLLGQAPALEMPQVVDSRLQLQLFAEAPEIVTPIAVAVDERGRVLCIESNTHFPPADYRGHPSDRIRMFQDQNGDGRADRVTDFYDGLKHAMGLGIYRDGSVYVATRSEILRLRDTNDDGMADERTRIAHLETAGDYPHNGLSGFAFDLAGQIYFGFGENLGADYKLIGTDGQTLSGGGEGGNIYRCGPNGEKLVRIATGFWNPFHLCFDAYGRLFAVDNDPDSRPPCRLLHIVDGGDYGYRFRNGRRGTHPFTAWNGELPGTLPMVAGTGEAPSGLLAYESDNLPDDYRGDLLATSWGDHRIERFRLKPRGASFTAEMTPVVTGGENFRPVGIALAPDGALYFSDWVDKSYTLHGKGRIWKLSAKVSAHPKRPTDTLPALASPHGPAREQAAHRLSTEEADRVVQNSDQPQLRSLAGRMVFRDRPDLLEVASLVAVHQPARWPAFVRQAAQHPIQSLPRSDARGGVKPSLTERIRALVRFERGDLTAFVARDQPAELRAAMFRSLDTAFLHDFAAENLDRSDPFLVQSLVRGLEKYHSDYRVADLDGVLLQRMDENPNLYFVFLQAQRHLGRPDERKLLPLMLRANDVQLRLFGLLWIGEDRLVEYRENVEQLLATGADTRQLFEVCVATLEMLENVQRKPTDEWRGEDFVVKVLQRKETASAVRRQALRTLRPDHPFLTVEFLGKLLGSDDAALRLEAVRSLRERPAAERGAALREVAANPQTSSRERAEAILGLVPENELDRKLLLELAGSKSDDVSREALRTLQGTALAPSERDRMEQLRVTLTGDHLDLADRVLAPPVTVDADTVSPKSAILDAQLALMDMDHPGDSEAGERIFFQPRLTGCYRCHEVNGRGSAFGPDLTTIQRSASPQKLLESIIQPSREIAPHYVPWIIETTDGRTLTGLFVGEEVDGTKRYIDSTGKEFRLKVAEIERRQPATVSIMPEGLASQLTPQAFRDLIAFLRKAK